MREQTEANKQRILLIAARLIIEKGANNTSLADIAAAAEISKGTLYYYYPTKVDLIFDITEKHMDQITNDLLRWIDKIRDKASAAEILRIIFNKMVGAKKRGRLHLYLIQEAVTNNESLKEQFKRIYKKWQKNLEEGLRKILKEKNDHEMLAHIILACLDGLLLQNMIGFQPISTRRTIEYLIK